MKVLLISLSVAVVATILTFIMERNYYPDYLMLPPIPYEYVNVDYSPKKQIHKTSKSRWQYSSIVSEKQCLAKNIFFEARGQDLKGQLAVALVTINRVKSKRFPNSICDVVWQKRKSMKTGKMVAQFSWTLDHISNIPPNSQKWKEIIRLTSTILDENNLNNIVDFTNGSMFYHNTSVDPYWNDKMTVVTSIGEHIFYTD